MEMCCEFKMFENIFGYSCNLKTHEENIVVILQVQNEAFKKVIKCLDEQILFELGRTNHRYHMH